MSEPNLDPATVEGFGEEWDHFDQTPVAESELSALFEMYFGIFPWDALPTDSVGFDLGCGSGRWARFVAPRVGTLHCIDPAAKALEVARRALAGFPNCEFHLAGVDAIPLGDESMDFGYSIGVLHHVPDTAAGIRAAVRKLKPGAPLLLYLYYAFDNRPRWYRSIWRASDHFRRGTSGLPFPFRYGISQAVAAAVYWPLARAARMVELLGRDTSGIPLSFYRSRSFYTMRTDALDRLGTRLEKRFRRPEIVAMMKAAGLTEIRFSDSPPFWCAVGFKGPRPGGRPASSGLIG